MSPFREKERLRWQCRRGMLELDLLLLRFLEERYDGLRGDLKERFREILCEADSHLFYWFVETPANAPPEYRELVELIREYPG